MTAVLDEKIISRHVQNIEWCVCVLHSSFLKMVGNHRLCLCWCHSDGEFSLQWRRNERDGVSNHQSHDCLLNRLFRLRSKKTSKIRVTGLCAGNSPVTGEFPSQRASNAESVSIVWRLMLCGAEMRTKPFLILLCLIWDCPWEVATDQVVGVNIISLQKRSQFCWSRFQMPWFD